MSGSFFYGLTFPAERILFILLNRVVQESEQKGESYEHNC